MERREGKWEEGKVAFMNKENEGKLLKKSPKMVHITVLVNIVQQMKILQLP